MHSNGATLACQHAPSSRHNAGQCAQRPRRLTECLASPLASCVVLVPAITSPTAMDEPRTLCEHTAMPIRCTILFVRDATHLSAARNACTASADVRSSLAVPSRRPESVVLSLAFEPACAAFTTKLPSAVADAVRGPAAAAAAAASRALRSALSCLGQRRRGRCEAALPHSRARSATHRADSAATACSYSAPAEASLSFKAANSPCPNQGNVIR